MFALGEFEQVLGERFIPFADLRVAVAQRTRSPVDATSLQP
jgi:hypothetical protein